jgi:hypothetical protein
MSTRLEFLVIELSFIRRSGACATESLILVVTPCQFRKSGVRRGRETRQERLRVLQTTVCSLVSQIDNSFKRGGGLKSTL